MIDLELVKESESISLKLKENIGTGTGDYNDLENKPSINGVELQGALTTEDLGIIVNAVKDVLINGTSIIDKNGNAIIPIANNGDDKYGLVKLNAYHGVGLKNGYLTFNGAGDWYIDNRNTSMMCAITPTNMDYALKQGMCDGKGAEWTPQEKAMARARMGMEWTLIDTIEVTEEVGQIDITFPQEYSEFMVIGDIKGNGASIFTPHGTYNTTQSYPLPFYDFYPGDKDEHFELIFEKMDIDDDTFLKVSGFESTSYLQKMKQNLQTTGWFNLNTSTTPLYPVKGYYGLQIKRIITQANIKVYAR